MPDDIRSLSAELARDPASLAYVSLAEALRRRGQLKEAEQVAMHGLARHPQHADGYDCLARIHADQGDLAQARAGWERVLGIAPEHVGALKGLGYVYWRLGDARRAEDALEHALLIEPSDEGARRALEAVRSSRGSPPPPAAGGAAAAAATAPAGAPPSPAPSLGPSPDERPGVFSGLEGATADILLLDSHGLVLAGGVRGRDGADVSELAAAALAGVSGEANRSAAYLGLGAWTAILAEAESAHVVLVPVTEGDVLMVRRDHSTPAGMALRVAERARGAARAFLEGQSG